MAGVGGHVKVPICGQLWVREFIPNCRFDSADSARNTLTVSRNTTRVLRYHTLGAAIERS